MIAKIDPLAADSALLLKVAPALGRHAAHITAGAERTTGPVIIIAFDSGSLSASGKTVVSS